jgi:hypothetical protein
MIKTAFREQMKMVFPIGTPSLYQVKSLATTFAVGFMEGMKRGSQDPDEFRLAMSELREIMSPDWMPNMSWCWWMSL